MKKKVFANELDKGGKRKREDYPQGAQTQEETWPGDLTQSRSLRECETGWSGDGSEKTQDGLQNRQGMSKEEAMGLIVQG